MSERSDRRSRAGGCPRGRVLGAAVLACLLVAGPVGCKDKPESPPTQEETQAEPEADASSEEDAEESIEEKRSAYGLPLPPKVKGVADRDSYVEMVTPMKIEALEEFYRTRLVDYEVLRPAPGKIRVVGLRQFMPYLRGNRYGPVTRLYYFPKREEPKRPDAGAEQADKAADTGIAKPSVGEGRTTSSSASQRVPGTPVELKTSDGEKLAPGAKWGEPYTPPPGTPLHRPEFRDNFGRPFGEWQMP